MLARIAEKSISVWYSVPSALVLMLDHGGLDEQGAPSLRVVFFAGEVFPIRHLRHAMAALPQARFFNLFGPTETNVCFAYEVRRHPGLDLPAIPIGRASCGDTAHILDEQADSRSQMARSASCMWTGPTVMLGYWDGGQRTPRTANPTPPATWSRAGRIAPSCTTVGATTWSRCVAIASSWPRWKPR